MQEEDININIYNMKQLDKYIIEKLHLNKDIETAEERDKSKPENWEVGDIIYSNFSYSMIIIDFYKIVKISGKTFTFRKLKDKIVSGNGQAGKSVPIPDEFDTKETEEKRARINKFGDVKLDKYTYCYYWNGEPVAFDHLD